MRKVPDRPGAVGLAINFDKERISVVEGEV